ARLHVAGPCAGEGRRPCLIGACECAYRKSRVDWTHRAATGTACCGARKFHAGGCAGLIEASDDELVLRVASGDEAACRILIDRHFARTLSLARRMLGSQQDAEEVAQEVFLRVWTHAERWEPGRAQFRTWLHRVA